MASVKGTCCRAAHESVMSAMRGTREVLIDQCQEETSRSIVGFDQECASGGNLARS